MKEAKPTSDRSAHTHIWTHIRDRHSQSRYCCPTMITAMIIMIFNIQNERSTLRETCAIVLEARYTLLEVIIARNMKRCGCDSANRGDALHNCGIQNLSRRSAANFKLA